MTAPGRRLSAAQVLRRRGALYLVCVLLATAEAVGLYLPGFTSALPLAPQVAAPPPFGAYHDLRFVFTFSSSWFSFAWQLAALLAFRTLVTAVCAVLAWPDDVPRPAPAALLARTALGTMLAIVVLSPWATLAFASSAVSYSWFMLTSIIAVGATAVVLPSALVAGAWWRRLLAVRGMLFAVVTWLALMVEALAVTFAPGWVAVAAAAASGALNALLWQQQVIAIVHAPRPAGRRRLPLSPVGVVAVLALFLVGGGYAIGGSQGGSGGATAGPATAVPAGVPLLYVPGYDSSYGGGGFRLLGTSAWHFSYAGLTGNGRPAPYGPQATHQSLATSARRLATQVDLLHRRSGAAVVLLADSEGSLVVRRFLEQHPGAPVRMFVEVSPLVRPARVYFPSAGRAGYGIGGGWEARELLALIRLENPGFTGSADEPFIRSVVANAGRLRGPTVCPTGHVPVYAFLPFEGALTVADRPIARVPWTAVPGYHATLLGDPGVVRDVVRLIRTGRLPTHGKSTAAFRVISGAAAAWQVPALPLGLRTAWHGADHTDAAFGGWRCAGR